MPKVWAAVLDKLATLWNKVPKPLRWFWSALGWLDNHFGRLLAATLIIGLIFTAGTLVIGYASEVDLLWVFVATVAVLVMSVWGVAGVAMYVQATTADPLPPVSNATEPTTEGAAEVVSDGLLWILDHWQMMSGKRRKMELRPVCREHEIPLLYILPYSGEPEPLSIVEAHEQEFGPGDAPTLYCAGHEEGSGHELRLTESTGWNQAVLRAEARMGAALSKRGVRTLLVST